MKKDKFWGFCVNETIKLVMPGMRVFRMLMVVLLNW